MNTLADVKLISLASVDHTPRGDLIVLEALKNVPFEIRRVFYVYGVKAGEHRGEHAHRECRQALVCVEGVCEVTCDDGRERRTFVLDTPEKALVLPTMIWAEQDYPRSRTALLVLTDQYFSEAEYIRDYAEFKRLRQAG